MLLNAGFTLKDVQEWIGQPILRGWLTFTGTWTRPGSRARRKNAPEASSSDVRNVLEKSGQIKAGTKRKSPETLRFQDFFWSECHLRISENYKQNDAEVWAISISTFKRVNNRCQNKTLFHT